MDDGAIIGHQSDVADMLASMKIVTEDFGALVARHVIPGPELATMAMVCGGWWKAARALQTTPDYDLEWAEHALPRQLEVLLRQLPDLEPDLRSPELAIGDGGHDSYEDTRVRLAALCDAPPGARRPCGSPHPINDITDDAIRARMCQRGGVPCEALVESRICDEARDVIVKFLGVVVRGASLYADYLDHGSVTGIDVAHALRGHSCSLPSCTRFAAPAHFDAPMPYLYAFSQAIQHEQEAADPYNAFLSPFTRVADVLLRLAAEEFVAEVFASAWNSMQCESLADNLALQLDAFQAAAR